MPFKSKEERLAYDKAYSKAWYEANKEKRKAYNKAYYEANKEKIKAYNKAYYEANKEDNKEDNRERARAYHEANKEKVKAYKETNKEKIKVTRKAYYEGNKEKLKAYREANKEKYAARQAKRKALKLKQVPVHLRDCPQEKQRLVEIYKLRDILSEATGVQHHVDHMWPLADGGPHWSGNLQVIPAEENLSKSASVCEETKATIIKSLYTFESERSI